MVKKIIASGLISIGICSCMPLSSSALTMDELGKLNDLDYVQQYNVLNKSYNEDTDKLKDIDKTIKDKEDYLKQNEIDLINTQREHNVKKEITTQKSLDNRNGLKLFEMILSSDSLGDLLQNVNIAKTIYVQKNKELSNLEIKENQLMSSRDNVISELEKIKKEKDSKEKELKELKDLKDNLEQLMKRKTEAIGFNPSDLLQKSNVSVDDMVTMLKGTALEELAPIYIEAENLYGVNAVFLASLTAQESGWGTSKRAVEDNNLTGFGVYSNSSTGINANSKRNNILQTAKWLKEQYLTPGASLYTGLSIKDVNSKYCMGSDGLADYNWSENITKIGNGLISKINK